MTRVWSQVKLTSCTTALWEIFIAAHSSSSCGAMSSVSCKGTCHQLDILDLTSICACAAPPSYKFHFWELQNLNPLIPSLCFCFCRPVAKVSNVGEALSFLHVYSCGPNSVEVLWKNPRVQLGEHIQPYIDVVTYNTQLIDTFKRFVPTLDLVAFHD